jgi:hypothetical protein
MFSDEALDIVQLKNGEYQVRSPYGWQSILYETPEQARSDALSFQRKPHVIRKLKSGPVEGTSRFIVMGRHWFSTTFQTYEIAQRWAAHAKGKPTEEYKPAPKISVRDNVPPEEDPLADVKEAQKDIFNEEMEKLKDQDEALTKKWFG